MNRESTVAIVGSGIVGTAVAYHLVQQGVDVTVFEKGPAFPYPHAQQYEEEIVNLYDNPAYQLPPDIRSVTQSGDYAKRIDAERGMVVGGSATHWWGVTPRMIPNDFQTRTQFGYGTDWPISYDDLEPYYVKAEKHIGVSGTTDDNPFAPPRSEPYPLPPFALSYGDQILAERFRTADLQIHTTPQARTRLPYDGRPGCANFGVCHICPIGVRYSPNHHLEQAIQSGHCTLVTDSSVRRILIDTSGRARGLLVQPNDGSPAYEQAAQVVLVAAGAIESARLLLLSHDVRHPDGVGNQSGCVGQNLTFHHIWSGSMIFEEPLYPGRVGPATGRSFQFLDPPTRGLHGGINVGMDDRMDLRWFMGGFDLWNVRDPEEIVERISAMQYRRGLQFHAESIPDANKFLALSEKRDRFGDPFAHVQYTTSAFDLETFAYANRLAERFFAASGASHAQMPDDPALYDSGAHHMGTCRMGDDPATSVTDSFGRVHGTPNLFVGGGAIFVGASGAVQPTLTMTALALRTADYLLDQLPALAS